MSQWTDELKAQVIEEYKSKNPTPENTLEILQELADAHDKTVNGVRMILVKAEVYVTKTPTASTDAKDKPKKKSKQDSLDELTALLTGHGVTVDETVVDKLTGKAAEFFIGALNHIIEE